MTAQPVLTARAVSKTFGARRVLNAFSVDIWPGEVHGLVGQNGSGKSTLIKILSGFHHPDPGGSLAIRGTPVQLPLQPDSARSLGMAFVHQDLGLQDSATVLENLRVGSFETGFGWRIGWKRERRRAEEVLRRFGLSLKADAKVSSLREVERALLAIVRALEQLRHSDAALLILDEPTAYLPRDAVDRVFQAIRDVAREGIGVLFVSHNLEEVRAITDRISILRDGALVETVTTADISEDRLIAQILGFALGKLYPEPHDGGADVVLSARDVSGASVHEVSLSVRRGEILGLTGLIGMGYEEVPYLLFGARRASSGTLTVGGQQYDLTRMRPSVAMRAGIALSPANRLRFGGTGLATVAENVTLPSLRKYFHRGFLRRRTELRRVAGLLHVFQVQPPEPERPFSTLSGGNQQKALLLKWFERSPTVFLLDEPTQGVDVGARREIFRRIRDAAQARTTFLLASSEYEDLAHLCDRVLIFRNGRLISEIRGAALTRERILEQCFREEERSVASRGA